ncbi:MAG: cyclic nucleotide-binding domain-containing protein, partial [Bdellovibrionales bacterium]|nr:cyclic nucleotide-binding domain-containing protein [Bdellovibrionales bacterium]
MPELDPVKQQMFEKLRVVPFFNQFPDELIAEIALICEMIRYEEGEEVMKQNQYNQNLFLLNEGRVGVYVDGGKVAELDQFGDLLGEMSVVQGLPSSATILAEDASELFRIGVTELNNVSGVQKDRLQHMVFRIYASVLSEKLRKTNEKAKHFEDLSIQLTDAKTGLEEVNASLEQKVEDRTAALYTKTQDLLASNQKLENQNIELIVSHKKLEELYLTKRATFVQLQRLYKEHLVPLKGRIGQLQETVTEPEDKRSLITADEDIEGVITLLQPITELYESEKNIQSQKVLLLDGTKKMQILAKMALGTTGADLTVAKTEEEAEDAFHQSKFDIVYLDESLLNLASEIQNRAPSTNMVIMTSEDIPSAIRKLQELPKMPNVVSRSLVNRSFTMTNIGTSLSKLASKDIFGLEKYLSWGTEIKELDILRSDQRTQYNEAVMEYFGQLGVRSSHRGRVSQALEEMLMNAIYDAPVDKAGQQLYNHLDRKNIVELGPDHQAQLRIGTEGGMMRVAV